MARRSLIAELLHYGFGEGLVRDFEGARLQLLVHLHDAALDRVAEAEALAQDLLVLPEPVDAAAAGPTVPPGFMIEN